MKEETDQNNSVESHRYLLLAGGMLQMSGVLLTRAPQKINGSI